MFQNTGIKFPYFNMLSVLEDFSYSSWTSIFSPPPLLLLIIYLTNPYHDCPLPHFHILRWGRLLSLLFNIKSIYYYSMSEFIYAVSVWRLHVVYWLLSQLCRRRGPLQAGPVGQAAQGAHGLHQAADHGAGERVQRAQLPHQAQALRTGRGAWPDGETGEETE